LPNSIAKYVTAWAASPFGGTDDAPWAATAEAPDRIRLALNQLGPEFVVSDEVAIHHSATIEVGAVIKGPAWIGPKCFIAAGAYLRGGVFLEAECVVGPGAELKASFMFRGAKLAHFNFVGDSILGERVNLEAGVVIANYRNEFDGRPIRIRTGAGVIETGVTKFGALVGDDVRVGANAVIAPGAIIERGGCVPRLALIDQSAG
jgi:NDP-sugar pyrophosphorylase family protein